MYVCFVGSGSPSSDFFRRVSIALIKNASLTRRSSFLSVDGDRQAGHVPGRHHRAAQASRGAARTSSRRRAQDLRADAATWTWSWSDAPRLSRTRAGCARQVAKRRNGNAATRRSDALPHTSQTKLPRGHHPAKTSSNRSSSPKTAHN